MATQPDSASPTRTCSTRTQFDAAIELLTQQQDLVGQYWALYTDQQAALEDGSVLAGTTWQVIVNLAKANGAKIDAVKPVEGATGWSDTWMISSKAKNPNCAYMWLNHIISPQANAEVAEWFGEAPATVELRPDCRPQPLHHVPCGRHRVLGRRRVLGDRYRGVPRRPHRCRWCLNTEWVNAWSKLRS